MDVQLKRLPKSRIELEVTVPATQMADFFASAYQTIGTQVEIAGFRPGHAPREMIRERVGEARIREAVLEAALPRFYQQALSKHELVPVAEPTVHVDGVGEDQPLKFRAEVDVLPDVETGNYHRRLVKRKDYQPQKVTKEMLDEALGRLRDAAATPKPVERAAQDGDWVELSYTGTIDGAKQENLSNQHHPLILGKKSLIPAFEKQLMGMKAKATKQFTIDLPGRDGAKHSVDFEVTMEQVAELIRPELNDELAKKMGKMTVQELEQEIEAKLAQDEERTANQGLETAVIAAVTKQAKVELPESLIEREVGRQLELLTSQLQHAGQTLESWLKAQKKELEPFRKELRPAAEQSVKTGLVLRAIADNEGFVKPGQPATEEVLKKTIAFLVEQSVR